MAVFFYELRRRHVSKVIASYAVVAWLLIQIAVAVEAPLGLPDWIDTAVIVALIIGFPVCAVLAWFYDLSGSGIERTADSADGQVAAPLSRSDRLTMAVAAVCGVVLVGTATWFLLQGRSPAYDSIAILPFTDLAPGGETAYLEDGLRDGLATRLSRLDGLRIKLGTSPADASQDVQALGASLGVHAICNGRFVQRDGAIEVVTELIDADDGSIIWRGEFSSAAAGLIAIEGDVAREIPRRLGFELTDAERSTLAEPRTTNPAAYRLYLQGRYFWNRRTLDGFMASIDYYQRAIDLDPNYGLAYSGLADAYLMLLGWGLERPEIVAPLVEQRAGQAIERDPALAEPHATLGYLRTIYDRDWDAARTEFLRAIALNANYATAHHWYAFLLMTEGNMPAAIEEILLARESEPLSPIINAEVGYFLEFDRQYQRAVDELEAASRLDPSYPATLNYLIRAYSGAGRREDALAMIGRWRDVVAGQPELAAFGAVSLPGLGLAAETKGIYDELVAESRSRYVMPAILGILAGALGNADAAYRHFDEAVETNSLVASWLRDPTMDPIRADPRYAMLFARLGLEP